MRVLAFLFALLTALPAAATEIIGALSQNRVSLTANFSGSEILIFGAIRRDPFEIWNDPTPQVSPFDVVIVIEGPRTPVTVWRKARRGGIWVNVESVTMPSVPSFYAVATTAPLHEILLPETDAQHRISAREAIRAEPIEARAPDPAVFSEALLRLREQGEQYLQLNRFVHLERGILFRATVQLPANLTEGAYTTRMYLLRDGYVVDQHRTAIFVRKDGLERWLHQLAYDQPLLYGILALVVALFAGWGASALFQYIRHS
jgi:uncharacterized protein (TIGR02186 family)